MIWRNPDLTGFSLMMASLMPRVDSSDSNNYVMYLFFESFILSKYRGHLPSEVPSLVARCHGSLFEICNQW